MNIQLVTSLTDAVGTKSPGGEPQRRLGSRLSRGGGGGGGGFRYVVGIS